MCRRLPILLALALPLLAQRGGSLSGIVVDDAQAAFPGVQVLVQTPVMPRPLTTVTNKLGRFHFPGLPPGRYKITCSSQGFNDRVLEVSISAGQSRDVQVTMRMATQEEHLQVTADAFHMINGAELYTAIGQTTLAALPVGETYRDLMRLAPGIQVSPLKVRGPSAGAGGQDNVYKLDGVDVSLPMFGTLSSEPAVHDVQEVSLLRGGARAVGFNRAGGFTLNAVSKSGSNELAGEMRLKWEDGSWSGDPEIPPTSLEGKRDQFFVMANAEGPILKDELFFFASYFGPRLTESNRRNAYGEQANLDSERDELFLKVTFAPNEKLQIHASHRDSDRKVKNAQIDDASHPTAAEDQGAVQKISIVDALWRLTDMQSLSVKWEAFRLESTRRPTEHLSVQPSTQLGSSLDLANLERMGLVRVPTLTGDPLLDPWLAPYLERYGYLNETGVRQGGGEVGVRPVIDDQGLTRRALQLTWEGIFLSGNSEHVVHVGFAQEWDTENLSRRGNGWGTLHFGDNAQDFLIAEFLLGNGQTIHSEFVSQSLEINDEIQAGSWTLNLGVLINKDRYYGEGLAADDGALSGFRLSPNSKYLMHEIDWRDLVQPRFSAVRHINPDHQVHAGLAAYHPAASSLPRAASWARNEFNQRFLATFNSDGEMVAIEQIGSSSGKFFQQGMKPRRVDEYHLGYSGTPALGWMLNASIRHKRGSHFWEDTENDARLRYASSSTDEDPTAIADRGLYIPELALYQEEIGGSGFVIAELDGAHTKYWEVSLDAGYEKARFLLRTNYTWSHYYGNFDQDNTSSLNDQALFIGSSLLADGGGRQIWDFKTGNLNGDRRHMLKVFGVYHFPGETRAGLLAFYQSGHPWEIHDHTRYADIIGSSTSDTIRFAEPAGSRTTPDHWQVDVNAGHAFNLNHRFRLGLEVAVFNLFDKQTGYDPERRVNSSRFGTYRAHWDPRHIRLSANISF